MKKFFVLVFLCFNFLFGANFLVELNATSKPSGDSVNAYFYTSHFRIIIAKDAVNDYSSQIENIKNTLEDMYNFEITKYGFKVPPGGDKYYIDCYLGQVGTVNLETNESVEPSPYFPTGVGEGKWYSTGEFYFNLYMKNLQNQDQSYIDGIIAHEFFHGVQSAYHFDESPTASGNWNDSKNRWFGESTATFIGNDLYANNYDIDAIIAKSKYWNPYLLNYPNLPLDTNVNQDEYSKDIIWVYVANKYGLDKAMGFLKDILQKYYEAHVSSMNSSDIGEDAMLGYVEVSSKDVLGLDFSDLMADFGGWVLGNFNVNKNVDMSLGKYGMAFYDNKKYSVVKTELYNMRDSNSNCDVVSNNVVIVNPNENEISSSIISNNEVKPLNLNEGWNLIGNIYNAKVPMSSIEGVILWVYRNNKFLGYSKYRNIQDALKKENLYVNDEYIYPGEGFFVFEDKSVSFSFPASTNELYKETNSVLKAVKGYDVNNSFYTYKNGWNIPSEVYPFEVIYDKGNQ